MIRGTASSLFGTRGDVVKINTIALEIPWAWEAWTGGDVADVVALVRPLRDVSGERA